MDQEKITMHNKLKLFISIFFIVLIFSGCISLTKELPSYNTYSLIDTSKISKGNKYNKTIRVYEPKSISSINTKAITYTKDYYSQEKYALNKWSDRPSKMIQNLMANSLTKTNLYKYITTSNIKINSDYSLISELNSLNHEFSQNSSFANFSVRIYLINNKTKSVYFKNFIYKDETKTNDIKGFIESTSKITNNFLVDLNIFIQKSLEID